ISEHHVQTAFVLCHVFPRSFESRSLSSCPTRRSSDLDLILIGERVWTVSASRILRVLPSMPQIHEQACPLQQSRAYSPLQCRYRSEEHTSELQSRFDIVCRLLLEKIKLTSLLQSSSRL